MSNLKLEYVTLVLALAAAACSGSSGEDSGSDGSDPGESAVAGAYLPDDGLIVIEFESGTAAGDWAEETAFAGFTGSSYLRWDGPNLFATPDTDTFGFDIWIEEAGTYHFRIHNRHEDPDATMANDCWVRMDDGDWVKTFSWQRGQWTWVTQHEFSHTNKPPAEYVLTRGNHRIEFSGRSAEFMMDRFHLYDDDVVNPESTAHPESAQAPASTSGTNDPGFGRTLAVSPFHVPALSPSGGMGAGAVDDEVASLDAALQRSALARANVRPLEVVLVDARSVGFGGIDVSAPLGARHALLDRLVDELASPSLEWVVELPDGGSFERLGALADDLRLRDPYLRPVALRIDEDQASRIGVEAARAWFDRVDVVTSAPTTRISDSE